MLTEQELVNQIASGNESVFLDEDVVSIDIPQIEMRIMMIHNALIHKLDTGSIQIKEVDWTSFMDSVFEMNHGLDFINRIQNTQLKNDILHCFVSCLCITLREFLCMAPLPQYHLVHAENRVDRRSDLV